MQAVRKQATVPEISALTAPEVMSLFLEGAMDAGKHGSKHKRLILRLLINSKFLASESYSGVGVSAKLT